MSQHFLTFELNSVKLALPLEDECYNIQEILSKITLNKNSGEVLRSDSKSCVDVGYIEYEKQILPVYNLCGHSFSVTQNQPFKFIIVSFKKYAVALLAQHVYKIVQAKFNTIEEEHFSNLQHQKVGSLFQNENQSGVLLKLNSNEHYTVLNLKNYKLDQLQIKHELRTFQLSSYNKDVEKKGVLFTNNGDFMVIPLNQLSEIIRYKEYMPLAHEQKHVLGIINIRGKLLPLIDFKMRSGFGPTKITAKTRLLIVNDQTQNFAVIVESIQQIVKYSQNIESEIPLDFNLSNRPCLDKLLYFNFLTKPAFFVNTHLLFEYGVEHLKASA